MGNFLANAMQMYTTKKEEEQRIDGCNKKWESFDIHCDKWKTIDKID